MALTFSFHPLTLPPKAHNFRPQNPKISRTQKQLGMKSRAKNQDQPTELTPLTPKWENWLSTAASLYPLYVTVGAAVASIKPSAFSWFVERAPLSYSFALGFIMLAMGLTLELKDLIGIFRQRSPSILFGCFSVHDYASFWSNCQQSIWAPTTSFCWFDFAGMLSWGHCVECVLQVTLIAKGDVPLSLVMTVCTTSAAVLFTPLLTKILAGAIIPVDAVKLSLSTLQVVVAPILLGSYMQSKFPSTVQVIMPFAPLLAVLASSLLASSVFSENVVRFKSSIVSSSELSSSLRIRGRLSGDARAAVVSVIMLHFAGFFVGYDSSSIKTLGRTIHSRSNLRFQRKTATGNFNRGWHANLFLGCCFSNCAFFISAGCPTRCTICCDHEYYGQHFGLHMGIHRSF